MARRGRAALTAALAVAAVLGAGTLGPSLLARQPVGGGEQAFAADELTWAQGSTLHYGEQTFDVGPEVVRSVLRTPYGFFLDLAESAQYDAEHRFVFFDGNRIDDVPGDVARAAVSPDGRYAGWVDFDGPLRLAGSVAEVVVVDLGTGEVVFRDHDHMGGGLGDDLGDRYEEIPPSLVGFDDDGLVYWFDAEGGGHRWRADPTTGVKERVDAPEPTDDGVDSPAPGNPYNPRLGKRVGWSKGEVARYPAGETMYLSPDGRYGIGLDTTGKVLVREVSTGRRVGLDHGRRWTYFAGWADGSTLHAMVTERRSMAYDPEAPDRSVGTLVTCSLPTGRCSDLEPVTGTRSVVFGTGVGVLESY